LIVIIDENMLRRLIKTEIYFECRHWNWFSDRSKRENIGKLRIEKIKWWIREWNQ